MEKRKTIALITACPEEAYQQSVFQGVFEQCERYGYNVAVFAMNVQTWHYFTNYLEGDENIYNLINFEKFDGVIVTPLVLSHNNQSTLARRVYDRINLNCKCKVVSLDIPFDDYDSVYTDDRAAFVEITNHLIEEHGCKDIMCLTGYADVDVSRYRLRGVQEALAAHGLSLPDERIKYGDFWYNSGKKLAEELAGGSVDMPDAIICANDHMAIGLIDALEKADILVPRDLIVTGYDATEEAFLYDMSLTTYLPDEYTTGAKAVNEIRKCIEPDKEVYEPNRKSACGLVVGETCGCKTSVSEIKRSLKGFIHYSNRGTILVDKDDPNDIAKLDESYMFETLMSQYTPKKVLENIDIYTYLIKPFEDFYLCLREDYLDLNVSCEKGYPDTMRMFIHRNVEHESENRVDSCFSGDDKLGERSFSTELMLPEMFEPSEKPAVFYFSPVHFNRETFGYAVLKCDLLEKYKIGSVYRNWIRYVGNALEMIRVKSQLIDASIEDELTGLLNRRGMDSKLEKLRKATSKKEVYVVMIDMDRLKYINDNFGHDEGDVGIKAIANTMKACAGPESICVRSGGDEFLIIGFEDDCENKVAQLVERMRDMLSEATVSNAKDYEISASFGFAVQNLEDVNIDSLIKEADERMYVEKHAKHAERV